MNLSPNPAAQGISLETLQYLMDQDLREDKRSVRNRVENRHQKILSLAQQKVRHLENMKNNQWAGALFGFFVNLFAQAAHLLNLAAPGTAVPASKAVESLQQINPFTKKSQEARLEADRVEAGMRREEFLGSRLQDYLNRLEEHERQVSGRLLKAQADLARSREAAIGF